MKISNKYMNRLETYMEWANCRTPFTGVSIIEKSVMDTPKLVKEEISPEEWMFSFETHGILLDGCSDPDRLSRYKRGKAMRDWWFKEIGENSDLGGTLFIPEEFMHLLDPMCFIELFGRAPITEYVRFYHDNHYLRVDMNKDIRYRKKGLEREQGGFRILRNFKNQDNPKVVSA